MEENMVTLTAAAKLARLGLRAMRLHAEQGRVRRVHTPLGWIYNRDDAIKLGRQRAETLELTGKAGRPRRREVAGA